MKNISFAKDMTGWSGPKVGTAVEVVSEKKESAPKKAVSCSKALSKCDALLDEIEKMYSYRSHKSLYDAKTHLLQIRKCLQDVELN